MIMQLVYFVISLGILVFIHEFGHFIAAKKQGIGVEKFSIGFGPQLFSFVKGETTYMVSLLPFGGYVKLHGEDPEEAKAGKTSEINEKKAFSLRPIYQRSIVVFAGPFMNLALAFVLMPMVFLLGKQEWAFLSQKPVVIGVHQGSVADTSGFQKGDEIISINETPVADWKSVLDYVLLHPESKAVFSLKRGDTSLAREVTIAKSDETHAGFLGVEPPLFIGNDPIVGSVKAGGPADKAGFIAGDRVISINGQALQNWTQMSEHVSRSEGKELDVLLDRRGEKVSVKLTAIFNKEHNRWLMGIEKGMQYNPSDFTLKKYSLGQAIAEGNRENMKLASMTMEAMKRLLTFNLSYKTLGGPIQIAKASAAAAESGLSNFIYFLVLMSLNLGIMNLLPFPVLDGGHLFFYLIEAIKGKPLSVRVQNMAAQVGFVLLITVMILVSFNDLTKTDLFRWIQNRF